MADRTGIRKDSKKGNVSNSNKGQVTVEKNDRPGNEGTHHIEDGDSFSKRFFHQWIAVWHYARLC